jgi:large subunit ribosomal protein L23
LKSARSVLVHPLLTEKAAQLYEHQNKYLFRVALDANKIDIKRAVEAVFNVHVVDVRTQVRKGKLKRMGVFEGRRPKWKKAIVTLKQGDKIDIFEGV